MRKVIVFNSVTLDGYFTGKDGDISWSKAKDDTEWTEFVAGNAERGGVLVFGRVTYDMMKSFWPTPAAHEAFPGVAERMNNQPKVVFSRTLREASWSNTTLVKSDPVAQIRKMKKEPGDDMVILGSGSIVSQLASRGVVDEYQIVVVPVVLGRGRTMFEGLEKQLSFKTAATRMFGNGNVFLSYVPGR